MAYSGPMRPPVHAAYDRLLEEQPLQIIFVMLLSVYALRSGR